MRSRLLALAVLFAFIGIAAPVRAQSGQDLVDACVANGGPNELCYGALHGNLRLAGGACRDATGNLAECAVIDGVVMDRDLVTAHERSWLARTLDLQQGLDDDRPLEDELWPHSHNSYNADAYPPSFYGLDRNQIYSVTDQLRMGIRAIEFDVWYTPSTTSAGANSAIVCHGEPIPIGPIIFNLGCGVNDPLLTTYLKELRAWLKANPQEVVILYLENSLAGSREGHDVVGHQIGAELGDLVYKPRSSCAAMPMDNTRSEIRESGKRVLIVGNCGAAGSAWGDWVHIRSDRWKEAGLDYGDDFPAYPCVAERAKDDYAHNLIRHHSDETGLTAGTGGGGDVTVTDARNMVRCGVNLVGMDNLVPFDPRLEQLAWSWTKGEPTKTKAGMCASHGSDGRFHEIGCKTKGKKAVTLAYTCYDGSTWHVTATRGSFSDGAAACAAEGFGAFSAPWNGYENERLKDAKPNGEAAWLNYFVSGGTWVS